MLFSPIWSTSGWMGRPFTESGSAIQSPSSRPFPVNHCFSPKLKSSPRALGRDIVSRPSPVPRLIFCFSFLLLRPFAGFCAKWHPSFILFYSPVSFSVRLFHFLLRIDRPAACIWRLQFPPLRSGTNRPSCSPALAVQRLNHLIFISPAPVCRRASKPSTKPPVAARRNLATRAAKIKTSIATFWLTLGHLGCSFLVVAAALYFSPPTGVRQLRLFQRQLELLSPKQHNTNKP